MLSDAEFGAIRDYRHRMRRTGCWGACYEVSCFIEHRYGHRRFDGVYQLADGTPVFKHSWNVTDGGVIVDGTADQFFHGEDIAVHGPGSPAAAHYREKYTRAHNPDKTPWLASRPYADVPDEEFWAERYRSRRLGPGWWLEDNRAYLAWMMANAEVYPLVAAKLQEYRSLGYGCDAGVA